MTVKETIEVKKDAIRFSKDFFAGAAAAAVAKTVVAPVERVKLILQLQNSQTTIIVDKRYTGMVECFIRLPKEQGFLSFWRGNLISVLKASSQESLGIASKNFLKKFFVDGVDPQERKARFLIGNLASGAGGGLISMTAIYPMEFVRTRLGVDMGKNIKDREFRGIFDCMKKIVKTDGVPGLYKGLVPSMQYIIVYRGFYYGLFDFAHPYCKKGEHLSFWRAFWVAQGAALFASLVSYPLDTIRRRLMMDAGKDSSSRQFKGTLQCAKAILTTEGANAFYHGFMVNSVRAFGAALVLALYNEMAKVMN